MRKVPTPPNDKKHFVTVYGSNSEKSLKIIQASKMLDNHGKYCHWDRLRYLKPPEGLTPEDWWSSIKIARRSHYKPLPVVDKNSIPFNLAMTDEIYQSLHFIDCQASGNIHLEEPVINKNTRDSYLINSLIEESISSSHLEGASTAHRVAKEMLKSKREPTNKDERMIFNNYLAMRFIFDNKDLPLTPAIILELHRIVSEGTLDSPQEEGRLRKTNDIVVIDDTTGDTLHSPPDARLLEKRLEKLCDFANTKQTDLFMHPVVKAITLHFMLAYDHPFSDGNGRTARTLFYWFMAKSGYWLMEYVSISNILKNAPAKYARSYLYTETDENDLTYFVIYQLDVIKRAINGLTEYLSNQARKVREARLVIKENEFLQDKLNSRQLAILNHALKHPNFIYSVKGHQNNHGITYETARQDLLKMSDKLGLLEKFKQGRSHVFMSPPDLDQRINGN